ncbi:MAG TPA: DUF4410 domain-containing protein [Stellaceae bacterium]|nr:DUF4410 domain-containing protein [Stellaceae bacterium]
MARRLWRWALGLAPALLVGACTTTTVTPLQVQHPTKTFSSVEIGAVQVSDSVWQPEIPHFQHGFLNRLQEQHVLQTVVASAGTQVPADVIVLSGNITTVDKGSKVARLLIGFGAGAAHIEGQFQITDASGVVLAQFENAKSYAGGAGIGGADFLDMDDLMEKFGADTADAVIAWSKGEMERGAQYGK